MPEFSKEAVAAYPDVFVDAGLGLGPEKSPWVDVQRAAFDAGAKLYQERLEVELAIAERAVAEAHEAVSLAAKAQELSSASTEWEYAWEADESVRSTMRPRGPRYLIDGQFDTPEAIAEFPRGRRVRRRKAGPWGPVPPEGAPQ